MHAHLSPRPVRTLSPLILLAALLAGCGVSDTSTGTTATDAGDKPTTDACKDLADISSVLEPDLDPNDPANPNNRGNCELRSRVPMDDEFVETIRARGYVLFGVHAIGFEGIEGLSIIYSVKVCGEGTGILSGYNENLVSVVDAGQRPAASPADAFDASIDIMGPDCP